MFDDSAIRMAEFVTAHSYPGAPVRDALEDILKNLKDSSSFPEKEPLDTALAILHEA